MATFGSIPSNDELNAGDNVGFAANLARTFIAASQAEEDALTNLRHGDELTRTDLGDNGIKKEWNGTAWVVVSGQVIKEFAVSAVSSHALTGIPPVFHRLELELAGHASNDAEVLRLTINGDTDGSSYFGARHLINKGGGRRRRMTLAASAPFRSPGGPASRI